MERRLIVFWRPTRLVQWTRRLRLCLDSIVLGGAPLTSVVGQSTQIDETKAHRFIAD